MQFLFEKKYKKVLTVVIFFLKALIFTMICGIFILYNISILSGGRNMKRFMKKVVTVILCCAMLTGAVTCFASGKNYRNYGKYVLLGDSVASGHNDLVYVDSEFKRVEDSYGAYVADELGVEYIPMACPGTRTIDMRYMLEDDYPADDYLFHDAHDVEVMKSRIPEYRKAISEAGLITLGVGGNDFGTFLTWVIARELEKFDSCNEYVEALKELLAKGGADDDTLANLDKVVELAKLMGAMPELVQVLPTAIKYGIENFSQNWDIVIEDILALNPDVELLVIGMFDNGVKNEEDAAASEAGTTVPSLGQIVVDLANTPMKEGAEKYGYTFVDTTGTVCDTYHPKKEGHRHIADRILAALPDADFPYTDVATDSEYYNDIQFMYNHGYMNGISDTEFGLDSAMTKSALAQALYNISGAPSVDADDATFNDMDSSDPGFNSAVWAVSNGILSAKDGKFSPNDEITAVELAMSLVKLAFAGNLVIVKAFKTIVLAYNIVKDFGFAGFNNAVTRAQAAQRLVDYCNL